MKPTPRESMPLPEERRDPWDSDKGPTRELGLPGSPCLARKAGAGVMEVELPLIILVGHNTLSGYIRQGKPQAWAF